MFTNQQHETSSIGANWPPIPDQHNRLRGFYAEEVVDSRQSLAGFTEQFKTARSLAETNGQTRLSVRTIATPAILSEMEQAGITVEGAIPLAGPYRPHVIAYTGWNAPERTMSPTHAQNHAESLRTATAHVLPTTDAASHLARRGLTSAFVRRQTTEAERRHIAPAFTNLYAPFGYTAEDTEALLLNPQNTIVYATAGDTVVSTAMAEQHTLSVPNLGDITIAEITEASTAPSYRGRGLYRAVSGLLGRLLLEGEDTLHAVYGESNLAMPGVLTAGHQNGRQFSYFDRELYGITQPNFGIVPQNVPVHDGTETRRYNDFAVSYLPLQ